jgi:hypothetical protein
VKDTTNKMGALWRLAQGVRGPVPLFSY